MKTRRVIGLLLALVMLISSVPIIAMADDEPVYLEPYDFVSHYPNRYEPFVELYDEYVEGSTYQWYKNDEVMDGETDAELKSALEFAAEYICIITLSDSTQTSVDFDTYPAIESQPTQYYPMFEVSDTDKVEGYQWYSHIVTDTAVTDENASNACPTCETEKYSSYDEENNLWSGVLVGGDGEGIYELFMFEVELKEGDQLLIDVGPEVQEIRIVDSDYEFGGSPSYSLVGDIGVFNVEVDETYTISIYTPSKDSTISAYTRTYQKDVLLEDETENELQNGELGGYYYCVANYGNDITLKSRVVEFIPEIYAHPNALTYEFDVGYYPDAKFQWYQVIPASGDDDEKIIALEGETDNVLKNYERGGVYYCEAAYPRCMVLVSKRVTAVPVIIQQPSAESPEFLVTFEDEAEFTWYEAEANTTFIDDTMATPAESDETATYNKETNEWSGAPWESHSDSNGTIYGLDIMYVELKAGTTLRFAVSDLSKLYYPEIYVIAQTTDISYYPEFTDDGYAYVTIAEDDEYNIYFYSTDTSVTITVENVEYIYTLIEGENDKKFSNGDRNVHYAAMATYDEDTVLVSDTFKMIPAIIKQPTNAEPSIDVNVKEEGMKYQWYEATAKVTDVTEEDVELTDEETPATYNEETKEWTPTIYDIIETEDGDDIYELDLFIMYLEAGEQVHFVPSEELASKKILAMEQFAGELSISPNKDGSYTFISPMSQEYYFYTFDDNAEVAFKVTKTSYIIGDAIEGENKAELAKPIAGTYVCVVTYGDGLELVSDVVIVKALGDANNDGKVDVTDYILVKRAVLKTYTLAEEEFKRADVDEDGDVDATDYVLVKRMVLGTYKVSD